MLEYGITFHESQEPITELVTKFGGQPTWIEEPQWPLSRSLGVPMKFIGQVALDPDIFGAQGGGMAYLFLTDDMLLFQSRNENMADTYDPEGGENAVIIQPGGNCPLQTQPLLTGPTVSHEFAVELTPTESPDFDEFDDEEENEDEQADNNDEVPGENWNKVSGNPHWLQYPEYPRNCHTLLLQLDSTRTPFSINFGDAGVGYAFLSRTRREGAFLWQCL